MALAHHPDRAKVKVLPNAQYDAQAFRLQYLKEAPEVDQSVISLFKNQTQKAKIRDKNDLLRIALFDLWTANEDRHGGNYNLLMKTGKEGYDWIPIDHGEAFNTGDALTHGLQELPFQESLLSSELCALIFQKPHNFANTIDQVRDEFDDWRSGAGNEVTAWITQAPGEWQVNKKEWTAFLKDQWLSDDWAQRVKQTFQEHCHSMIHR